MEVVIVGGGVIGSAIACFTLSDPAFRGTLAVVERDPTYGRASSALSASSIRQQFSTSINVRIGQFGIAFLREAHRHLAVDGDAPALGLVEPGYLFLATGAGREILEANHAVQRACGADVALLPPESLRERFPWLSTDGIAAGSLGLSGEGWFDGYSLLQGFRRKARALGARYVTAEAVGLAAAGPRVTGVTLSDGSTLPGDVVVNAGGPWSARLVHGIGIDLPVRARRRSVFVFECPDALPRCPLVIDPSGLWFRPEGTRRFICGAAPDPADDADDAPLEPEHHRFEAELWPILAGRVPAFEALRQTRAWAGYYEMNTFDHNGIVGPHPEWANLLFATGFSGHGMQQSPAVGRGVAELLVHGGYRTLDLSPLGYTRIHAREPLVERSVV
jgi:glycine/D-amino acid oxidase-like deaminating enzyme